MSDKRRTRAEWLARERTTNSEPRVSVPADDRPENSTSTSTPRGNGGRRASGVYDREPEHDWIANDGRGGKPSFALGAHPYRSFRHLSVMPARCRDCGVRGWFTARTWRSTLAVGPGPCPEGS